MVRKRKRRQIVRPDKNFLQNPLYTLQRYLRGKKPTDITIQTPNGTYTLATGYKQYPDRWDMGLFYYIQAKLEEMDLKTIEIRTTLYNVCMDLFDSHSKANYERIMEGFKRLGGVLALFEGIFYDGDDYTERIYGMLAGVKRDKKTKELVIWADPQYIEWLRHSKYRGIIDWRKFLSFKKDMAARLYEIFACQPLPWSIEARKFAQKLTLGTQEPARILRAVQKGMDEFNKALDNPVKFTHYRNRAGELIFKFDSGLSLPGD